MKNKKSIFIYLGMGFCFLTAAILTPGQQPITPESPGKLSKVHGDLSGPDNCTKCHSPAKKIEPTRCLSCHKELDRRIKAGTGFHRDKTEDCDGCHSEHNGENHKLVELHPADFDHSETGYSLTGAHREIKACERCHNSKNSPPGKHSRTFLIKDNCCSACHKDSHRGNQPICTDCHNTEDWNVDIW